LKDAANSIFLDYEVMLVPARRIEASACEIKSIVDDPRCDIIFAHGAPVRGLQWRGRYWSRRKFAELLAARIAPLQHIEWAGAHRDAQRNILLVSSTVIDAPRQRTHSLAVLQAIYENSFRASFDTENTKILRVGTVMGVDAQFPAFVDGLTKTRMVKKLRVRGDCMVRTCQLPAVARFAAGSLASVDSDPAYAVDGEISLNDYLDKRIGPKGTIKLALSHYLSIFGLLGVPAEFFLSGHKSCRSLDVFN
jgi:hypothetical protein